MSDIFGGDGLDGFDDYETSIWWTDSEGNQLEVSDWWYGNMTLPGMNDQGPVVTTMSSREWFYAMRSQDVETFYNNYGMSQYDLIRMLERNGFWTDEDWRTFHDNYEG